MFGKLSSDWDRVSEIAVFGFGNTAEVYLHSLHQFIVINYIIDNDTEKYGKQFEGIPVCSFDDFEKENKKVKIVIVAETLAYDAIKRFLEKKGYIENKDFTGLERFICEWSYKSQNMTRLMEIHTAVNTCCTFNCINCNMFIPYHSKKLTYSCDELIKNINMLMKHVDFVFKYQLVGGEPLLNKDIEKFLEYLGENYKTRIGRVRLITNGTIVPSDSFCLICKNYDYEVFVSDYSCAVPQCKPKLFSVIQKLNQTEVKYKVGKSLKWRDFGFPRRFYIRTPDETIEHMHLCGTAWHGLADEKLFYCNSEWSAEKTGMFISRVSDYIDISSESDNVKENILKLCLGEYKEGYNSFCQICGGCGDDNQNFVSAGIQM